MDSETIEKKADVDRSKAIKAAIAAAVASAGVGAFVSGLKAKRNRGKALDAFKSKNAIVVPIGIPDFVKDLPTPEEFKKMYAGSPDSSSADMSAEDIASRKKDILKGRKVNFFKRANKDQGESKTEQEGGEKKKELVSEEKIDGRVVLRGQDGKFVSPTDPVAVQQVEKEAGIWDAVKGWGGRAKDAFMGAPVVYTAGALGSLYLAAMIADYVNKKRREKTEENVDAAREEYVEKLQSEGGEKNASGEGSGLPEWAGTAFGASFFVPLAVTALVTNKILENRKQEKKKQKEMADSYPDDPIILYKTIDKMAGCREVELSPEDFIALLSVKTALIKSAERDRIDMDNIKGHSVKSADWVDDLKNGIESTVRWGAAVNGYKNPYSLDEASIGILDLLEDPANNQYLRDMIKETVDGSGKESDVIGKMLVDRLKLDPERQGRFWGFVANANNNAALSQKIKTSDRLQKLLINRMTGDNVGDMYKELNEYAVNSYLKDKKNGWGLDENGILYKIVSWIVNNLGLGKYFVGKRINSMFDTERRNAIANAEAASANVANNKTQPQPQPQPIQGSTDNTRDLSYVSSNFRQMVDQTKASQQERRKQMLERINAARQNGQMPVEGSGNSLRLRPVPSGSRVQNPASKPRARLLRPARNSQTPSGVPNNTPNTPVRNANQNPT